MTPRNRLNLCLGFAIFFPVAFAVGAPEAGINDPTEAPEIVVDCDVDAGQTLDGHAWDSDAPIRVEAIWDDDLTDVTGSPDPGGFGTHNYFAFSTVSGDSGRTFTITATDRKGHEATKRITVN